MMKKRIFKQPHTKKKSIQRICLLCC